MIINELTTISIADFRRHSNANRTAANLFVDVPVDRPHGYNTTERPVHVDLHLDPASSSSSCRISVRVRNSFRRTAANIVQQFSHWLPAHLMIVVLLGLKQQVLVSPKGQPFKCAGPTVSVLRSSSFFIITASRLFVKLIEWSKVMPAVDGYEHSMVVSILWHGAAVAMVVLAQRTVGVAVRTGGSVWYAAAKRMAKVWPTNGGCAVWLGKCPAAVGTILLGIVLSTCGGLALALACVFYLMIVSRGFLGDMRWGANEMWDEFVELFHVDNWSRTIEKITVL